ncbi:fibronectin type III domain-containing protein 11 [Oxyura jamaicensis]|uniref:fibronectin type III domain-containing protein 11 n=1 Tax=Oxyura jamaicensis TaxID=8884 RepID=UPI0015A677D7|nr:fibronectin type III domain-containing protein 11 [Oxyura jamaicensis]
MTCEMKRALQETTLAAQDSLAVPAAGSQAAGGRPGWDGDTGDCRRTGLPGAGEGTVDIPEIGQANFGIMNMNPNEFVHSLERTVCSKEEQDNAILNMYMERKSLVLQFLQSDLSPQLLEHHHKKVELLKKCYYYIEVLPSHVILRDQNRVLISTDIFQIIDPWRLQRMKKVARTQTEIQLVLLTDLLEQLQRGREELACYVGTSDVVTFLSEWESVMQKLSELSELMNKFLSLQVPGKLHAKHRLVSHADLKGTRIPNIKLFLRTKMPVMFDRKESVAHKNWAHLKWFTENQESPFEQYELHFRLLMHGTQTDVVQRGIVAVSSNTCVVRDLLPDRSYEFTIRRAETYTLVYETWHDIITLMTVNSAEDSSTCEPEERGDRRSFLIFST